MTGGYRDVLRRLHVIHGRGLRMGLDRVRQVLALLGGPERKFLCVQVAGTNGKGSTVAMTDAICRAAGYRTGMFTSPHLNRFTERIHIDGNEIDGDALAPLLDRIEGAEQESGIELTYFETSCVLALLAMAGRGVEVAILETGLGGRLDAVTAVPARVTAITSIGLDHQDLLGAGLRDIAREKAAIARAGVPLFLGCFSGPQREEATREVIACAAAQGAKVLRRGIDFFPPDAAVALSGAHQIGNAAVACAMAREAGRLLGRPVPDAAVTRGLATAHWPGRLEWITDDVLLDGAHNPEAASALRASIEALPAGRRPGTLVTSIVRGKDASGILAELAPVFARVIATRSSSDRAMTAEELARIARAAGAWRVDEEPDPSVALDRGRGTGQRLVVAGSLFLVGQIRASITHEPQDSLLLNDPPAIAG